MASSNRHIECCICLQGFNSTSRRPRGLPCLHNYCTECVQGCIEHGRNTCSICRKPYTATRVEDIPINNSLEALIEMIVQMASTSSQTNDSNDKEDEYENKYSYEFLLKDPKRLSEAIEKGDRDIYAVDNASIVRSSKLQYENGIVKINTLGKYVKPTPNATLIPITSLMSILCTQPVVYLDLEAQGHPLGRLRILLTCGPRRKEQAIQIFTGIAGTTLKGHCFDYAVCVGEPGESIWCCNYLDANGRTSNNLLVADPELNRCNRFVAGQVTGCGWADTTDFLICTTTAASFTSMDPELGRVLTGLDMLSTAIRQYNGHNAQQIKIVNTGLEITS